MAKIVKTLTRASSESEEDVAQSLGRELGGVGGGAEGERAGCW